MKKLGKILTSVLCAAVVGGSMSLFAGCGGSDKETVLITGSSSVEAVMTPLAAAYEKKNKDVRINVTPNSSGTGITDTKENRNDFGMSSRALKQEEIDGGLTGVNLCLDGIAVVVKKDNAAEKADNDQLFALYTAGTSFTDNGATISTPVGREASSGTRDAFDENIKSPTSEKHESIKALKCGYRDGTDELSGTGLVIDAVSNSATAVGYVSLGSYLSNTGKLKALKFKAYGETEYVEPTTANVLNGSYKLQRPFVIVTKTGKKLSSAAQKFYDWLFTDEQAQTIISDHGYVLLGK